MAPLTPTWKRPSHPDIQEVMINDHEFTSKSLSKVSLPPFGLFARMDFPPCTLAEAPTYATVQCGRDKHLNLNSDLLYIIFDTANLNIIAGPKGLRPGDELTFFYPSTEWSMAQPFDCLCGAPSCRGRIAGARDMAPAQLSGAWLNGHIREMKEEQQQQQQQQQYRKHVQDSPLPPHPVTAAHEEEKEEEEEVEDDLTAQALRDALGHAEKVVEAARAALRSYVAARGGQQQQQQQQQQCSGGKCSGGGGSSACASAALEAGGGLTRRGATSRELSGEMGGDTVVV
ncbi:hypothetical protein F4809DRAFT_641725 [Biscogniauxia mediterranea]|nr:hypothetical protein F4809DRAFT_641725 [Biscogniauxia mediterranea]